MRKFIPLFFTLCCACHTVHERQVGPVAIRAETAELADRTAAIVTESLPRFPVPHEQGVSLVVRLGKPDQAKGGAYTLDANVWIDPASAGPVVTGPDFLGYVVVHELLHLYIRPAERARLPALLEEGLVDRRTLAVRPDVRTWRRTKHVLALLRALGVQGVSSRPDANGTSNMHWIGTASDFRMPPLEDVFAITRADFGDPPSPPTESLTALGWFLWECAGEESLPALLERAEAEHTGIVQPAWICAVAGLDPMDLESWTPKLMSLLGPDEHQLIEEVVSRAALEAHAP